jgi:uroporphyrinogen decarboxylase
MNCREAMKAVIVHHEVRPVPYTVKFTVEALERMRAERGSGFDPVADTGTYSVSAHTNNGWTEVKPGYFRDYFGVVWNKTMDRTLGVVDEAPLKTASLAGFRFPDPNSAPVYDALRKNNQRYPEHFRMLSIGFALFERAWSLVGMENLLMYFMTDPAFVQDLLERIADYNIALIRNAAAIGVDAVHFGDDWGSQHAPLVDPQQWRELVKPSFKRMCAAAREKGLIVSLHSCGQVSELFPDMIECGVDVFDPFQPEAMDIWQMRKQYRGKLAFWGGLSVQHVLPHGTVDDVKRETRRLLDEMAPGGGYVLSPSHSVTGDVPVENVEAFLEVARGQ